MEGGLGSLLLPALALKDPDSGHTDASGRGFCRLGKDASHLAQSPRPRSSNHRRSPSVGTILVLTLGRGRHATLRNGALPQPPYTCPPHPRTAHTGAPSAGPGCRDQSREKPHYSGTAHPHPGVRPPQSTNDSGAVQRRQTAWSSGPGVPAPALIRSSSSGSFPYSPRVSVFARG